MKLFFIDDSGTCILVLILSVVEIVACIVVKNYPAIWFSAAIIIIALSSLIHLNPKRK